MDKNSLWGEGRLPSLQPSLRGAHLGTTDTTLSASQPTCARVGAQPSPPLLSALILLSIFSSGPQGPADTEGSVAVGVLLDEYFMLGRAYCTAPARQLPALPGCLLEEASAGRGTSQAQALPPSKGLPVAVPSDLGGGGQTHPTFRRWRGGPCRGTWGNATEVAPWDPAPDRPQHLPAPPSTSYGRLPSPGVGSLFSLQKRENPMDRLCVEARASPSWAQGRPLFSLVHMWALQPPRPRETRVRERSRSRQGRSLGSIASTQATWVLREHVHSCFCGSFGIGMFSPAGRAARPRHVEEAEQGLSKAGLLGSQKTQTTERPAARGSRPLLVDPRLPVHTDSWRAEDRGPDPGTSVFSH